MKCHHQPIAVKRTTAAPNKSAELLGRLVGGRGPPRQTASRSLNATPTPIPARPVPPFHLPCLLTRHHA